MKQRKHFVLKLYVVQCLSSKMVEIYQGSLRFILLGGLGNKAFSSWVPFEFVWHLFFVADAFALTLSLNFCRASAKRISNILL